MKNILAVLLLSIGLVLPSLSFAATDREKAFIDSYKKAYETKDEAGLMSFLYTKGADPTILGFYSMMLTSGMGSKITSIELVNLTPEDMKKATALQPSPSGEQVKLPLTPIKKLVVKVAENGPNGSSTSTSESFVAEADGKLVIPVPGPVK